MFLWETAVGAGLRLRRAGLMKEPRTIVAVAYPLGRAGSSALMGLLKVASVHVGADEHLSKPAPMNPKGFFELPAQEEFLRHVYASVYPEISLPPCLAMVDEIGERYADDYMALLSRELGDRFPAGVKSQWFLTLPFLHRVRDDFDVRVLALSRNLEDQTNSLLQVYRQTDRPVLQVATPEFVSIYIQAWSQFGEQILNLYRFPTLAVSFDELMSRPLETTRTITDFLGLPGPPEERIRDWLDPSLTHRSAQEARSV